MRVYIKYEPGADAPAGASASSSLKIKLPTSWKEKDVSNITQLWLDSYNKKHGLALSAADFHVESADGRALANDAIISTFIKEHDEVNIKPGAAPAKTAALTTASLPPTPVADSATFGSQFATSAASGTAADVADGKITCRNYGCQARFSPGDNPEGSCRHHTAPPGFREAKKFWSCCPDKLGWDWDEFMAIPGCAVGKHAATPPAGASSSTFAPSPTVAAAAASGGASTAAASPAAPAVVIKSIDDYNAANVGAPTAVTSLQRTLAGAMGPKKLVVRADGKKQCVHFACGRYFGDDENGAEACR